MTATIEDTTAITNMLTAMTKPVNYEDDVDDSAQYDADDCDDDDAEDAGTRLMKTIMIMMIADNDIF